MHRKSSRELGIRRHALTSGSYTVLNESSAGAHSHLPVEEHIRDFSLVHFTILDPEI